MVSLKSTLGLLRRRCSLTIFVLRSTEECCSPSQDRTSLRSGIIQLECDMTNDGSGKYDFYETLLFDSPFSRCLIVEKGLNCW